MIEEAELANDFGRILEEIEQQLSAFSIWQ